MSGYPGIYVAGTSTEVGKTVISAALVAGLRQKGLDAGYLKPVGTDGVMINGVMVNPDPIWVGRVAGLDDSPERMNPICLKLPLSPLAASRLEGESLNPADIQQAISQGLGHHQLTVVEGVGGLLVPMTPGRTFLDFMQDQPLPVVLAAQPGLGTINHTLLSLEALKQRGLPLAGFCFSGQEEPPAHPGASNAALIAEFSGTRFLGALPRIEDSSAGWADLADHAVRHLDLEAMLEAVSA